MIDTPKRRIEELSVLNIELTNSCNLHCVFCDHRILKHKMEIKDIESFLFEKILEDTKEYRIYELGLVGLGEPLLNKKFDEHVSIIERYQANFTRISLNTNGVALNAKKANRICTSPINHITISMNATNEETYFKLHGINKYNIVLKNIKNFLNEKKCQKKKIEVGIQVLPFESNNKTIIENELSEFLDNTTYVFYRDMYNKPVLENDDNIHFIDKIKNNITNKRYPCWSIFSRVYIDVNGNCYPCTIGNDSYRETSSLMIGNVKDFSIINLFNHSYLQEARNRSLISELPFSECSKCNIWSLLPNNFNWNVNTNKWAPKQQRPIRLEEYERSK